MRQLIQQLGIPVSRRISLPVPVETDAAGEPVAFTWRGVRRRVEVIGRWHLRDRWWVSSAHYYRLMTKDFQVFDVYRELTSAGLWVLDIVHD
jgi:hypothetical protein